MSEDNSSGGASAPVVDTGSAEVNNTESQEAKPVETAVAAAKRKFTYKADGQEIHEELDDTEIVRRLSLSKSAMSRMNEAHKTKQQAEALIREFQDNPAGLFKKLDATKARSAAEAFLLEQIKAEMMSPEERERQEMKRKLQSYEEQENKVKQDQQAKQDAELQARYTQTYSDTIIKALETSGLPRVPSTVKRMASLMYKNLELGLDLSPADLVDEVKKSYYSEFKEMFGGSDASFILSMFGDDVANKIRKHDLAKFQQGSGSKAKSEPQVGDEQAKRTMTRDEYREYLDKKFKS